VQQSDPLHYQGFTGAFASFFETGNPNTLKLTNSTIPGVPPFSSHQELVITPDSFDNTDYSMLERRCRFWKLMAAKVPM
jgi:hypothetical protein